MTIDGFSVDWRKKNCASRPIWIPIEYGSVIIVGVLMKNVVLVGGEDADGGVREHPELGRGG